MRKSRNAIQQSARQLEMPLEAVASTIGYLKLADILAPEDTKAARLLNRLAKKQRFESGQQVYPVKPGEPILIIVTEGTLKLFLCLMAKQTFLKRIAEESIIGEMPSWGQRMLGIRAVAEGQCEVWTLDEPAATALKRGNTELLLRLQHANASQLCQCLEQDLDDLRTFECKLASFLISKADEHGIVTGLTHAEIAAAFRTHRETVTKAVADLRRRGWIASKRRRITLLDIEALREFASW